MAIGIRFEIGKIHTSAYGIECWKIFWQAVDIQMLGGAWLLEGDTAATLEGRENVYCVAVQSIDAAVLTNVRSALDQSAAFEAVAASPKFVDSSRLAGEPLLDAGQVDAEGNLAGKAFNSRVGLGAVLKERQSLADVSESVIAAPERRKPASSRTVTLPSISTLDGLGEFLLTTFGKENWRFWMTPEELCDIVERYADLLQVQWHENACGLSVDMTYVTLFKKGKLRENIGLCGLFPFGNASTAKAFCNDTSENYKTLLGQFEGLYGIRDKYAINFYGSRYSSWINEGSYKKDRDIAACDLWPKLWVKMQRFSKDIEESKRRAEEQEHREEQERKRRREEQARRRIEEETRQRAEEQRRSQIQDERKTRGQCPLCGHPIGFFAKLARRTQHRNCKSFRE